MRLAQPVMLGGVPLFKEGMALTERHIERLASFGVETVAIEPETSPDALQDAGLGAPLGFCGAMSGYYAERLVRLDRLFRRHEDDQWMDKVRMTLEAYFLGRIALSSRRGSPVASRR